MPQVILDPARCKGCGLCIAACPQSVLAAGERANQQGYFYPRVVAPQLCLGCGLCAVACPDVALTLRHTGTVYRYFSY